MHSRNIYKSPPDFKELAVNYPEFREYVKVDLSGKARIDFQNVKAVAELTKTLLLKDFNLKVEIPCDKLVPTLPLRLNYILWIEDLLSSVNAQNVFGIDIGTGASCIYPLLASKNKWRMLGTEVLTDSVEIARRNVQQNSLADLIDIVHVPNKALILKGVISEEEQFTFCMCNPPFFCKNEDPKNRNNRPESQHAHTGNACELETDGGEITFIQKLIKDSLLLREKVLIYTTMIGKKSNLKILKKELLDNGLKNISTTEFVQGRTFRWGLAWSFNVPLATCPKKRMKEKLKPPVSYALPETTNFDEAVGKVKELMSSLKVSLEVEEADPFTCNITAFENTWSNQRRKRRAHLHQENSPGKKLKTDDGEICISTTGSTDVGIDENKAASIPTDKEPLLEFILKLIKTEKSITVEAFWIAGSAGKEGMHQVLQFMKNKWSVPLTSVEEKAD